MTKPEATELINKLKRSAKEAFNNGKRNYHAWAETGEVLVNVRYSHGKYIWHSINNTNRKRPSSEKAALAILQKYGSFISEVS